MTTQSFTSSTNSSESVSDATVATQEAAKKSRESQRLISSMTAELQVGNDLKVPATIKDISSSGMGFCLRDAVPLGEVAVTVMLDDEDVRLRLSIEWCRPDGNGMYLAGGSYLRRKSRVPDGDG